MNEERRIGVYVCQCGTNISSKVDVAEVVEFARALPGVAIAREYKFMCSDPGQSLIREDIKEHALDGVVVASCSPLMHEQTFRDTCEDAGLNPYLFTMANIREHCSWVTLYADAATDKAMALVAGAVKRAALLEPLERRTVPVNPATLVVGGGIAGIQAAIDIAESGRQVYLVERGSSIGGHMAKFDKTFPTLDCSACILTPKMVEVGKHPQVDLLTGATVEDVTGHVGGFKVRVRQKARYVDLDKCTACGECETVCPVTVPDEFEEGLGDRHAIYRSFPQAVPGAYLIDHPEEAPCKVTCPIGQDVQGYLALVAAGKLPEAHALIRRTNPLPALCGRVCYHACEEGCRRGLVDEPISVRAIKRFVLENTPIPEEFFTTAERTGRRVAIVGSGPGGLAAAQHDLAHRGHDVTVYEREKELGGMARLAIPSYRLPRSALDADIDAIRGLGVRFRTEHPVDGDELARLRVEHDAVFLSTGATRPMRLKIPGEDTRGVLSGIEFLRRLNIGEEVEVGQRVAVIGGGNTAIDAARTVLRLGAENVDIYYRRSREEMPASDEEVAALVEEGIEIDFLVAPTRVIGEHGRASALELQRMRLGEPDASGRRRPLPIPDSEFRVDADLILAAVSQSPELDYAAAQSVELHDGWAFAIDPLTGATNVAGLFAGGDAVRGPASVVEAIADGQRAARAIHNSLVGLPLGEGLQPPAAPPEPLPDEERLTLRIRTPTVPRSPMPTLDVGRRIRSFEEVEVGYSAAAAAAEAARCLGCGVCAGCRECEKVCEPEAIQYDMPDRVRELEVGTVVLATGFKSFDAAEIHRYGYGRHPEVYTALEFERLNNASGATSGQIRTKDGRVPESIGIIHCVGSRDQRHNAHCSRVCCMDALKFAHLAREKTDAEVYNFYIDMRCFGKGYEEFYQRLLDEEVRFVRGRPALVTDFPLNDAEVGKLVIRVEDTLVGQVRRIPVDMVVLSTGLEAQTDAPALGRKFGVAVGKDGFFIERHPKLAPVSSATDGVYLAGACQGPKDIPDSVAQASGAAAKALSLASRGHVDVESATCEVEAELCSGCRTCANLCAVSAIEFDEESNVSTIHEALCKGCGTCAAACPSGAITARHYTDAQIFAEIEGVLHDA